MYVQVVTYGLAGMGEREYLDVANSLTPRFSAMPGLLAKLWLANTEEGRYGAVYLWDDREAMERFVQSELFEATNPEFSEIAVEHFDVLENLTADTQPVLELIQPRLQRLGGSPQPALAKKATKGPRSREVPAGTKAATKRGKAAAKQAPAKAPAKKAPAKKAPAKKAPAKGTKKTRKGTR